MIIMILKTGIIKDHHINQSSDNLKAATRNPVEALRYE